MSGTLTVRQRNTVPHMNGVVERFTAGVGHCPASSSDGVPPTLPDLEDEAVRLGVRVTWQELPAGYCGVYDWTRCRIVLHDGLTPIQARCTLCHELEHVRHFDRVCGGKGEARARRRTALRLVSPVAYAAAEQVYEGNTWLMAVELGATAQVIDDYRQLLYDSGVCMQ
ncbi:hypothetical protein CQR48_0609 [Bifidobacterium thermophilum]|nr:hypothetical protein CQR48_0609 [Bifidobacterium thermophilum]